MPTPTTKYDISKPLGTENFTRAAYNAVLDQLDAAIFSLTPMTTAQRDALTGAKRWIGRTIIVTDATPVGLQVWDGDEWIPVTLGTFGIANVRMFGAIGDGVADDTAAIEAAQASLPNGGIVYFPPGTYKITSKITLLRGITFRGAGYLVSKIKVTGAIQGLEYAPGVLTESNITIEDLGIHGTVADALELVRFANASKFHINRCNIRETSTHCVRINFCFDWSIHNSRIENYKDTGVYVENTTNLWNLINVDFQTNAIAVNVNNAAMRIVSSNWGKVISCDFEGSGSANASGVILDSAGWIKFDDCFFEQYGFPAIRTVGAGVCRGIKILECHVHSSGNSVVVDFSANGVAHEGIVLDSPRCPSLLPGGYVFHPGSTDSYRYLDGSLEGAGTHVFGQVGSTVIKEKADAYATRPPIRLLKRKALLTGATPSVKDGEYFEFNNGSAVTVTNLLDGVEGQVVTIRNATANVTTLQNGANLVLAGAVNYAMGSNDVVTLRRDGSFWLELNRSNN